MSLNIPTLTTTSEAREHATPDGGVAVIASVSSPLITDTTAVILDTKPLVTAADISLQYAETLTEPIRTSSATSSAKFVNAHPMLTAATGSEQSSTNVTVTSTTLGVPLVSVSPRFVKRRSKVTREGVPDFEGKALTRAWGNVSAVSDYAYQNTAGSISSASSTYSHSPQRHLKPHESSISGHDVVAQPPLRRAAPEFGVYAICGHRSTMEDAHLAIPNIAENAYFPQGLAHTSAAPQTDRTYPRSIATDTRSVSAEVDFTRQESTLSQLPTVSVLGLAAVSPVANPSSSSDAPRPSSAVISDLHGGNAVSVAVASRPPSPTVSGQLNSPLGYAPLQSPYPPSRVRTRLLSAASNASVLSSFSQISLNSLGHGAAPANELIATAAAAPGSAQALSAGSRGSTTSSNTPSTASRRLPQPHPQQLSVAQTNIPSQPQKHRPESAAAVDTSFDSVSGYSRSSSSSSSAGRSRRPQSAGRSLLGLGESPGTAGPTSTGHHPVFANCRGFFCVCDGHGGAQCSEWVSDNLAPILFTHPEFNTNVVAAVHDTFAEVEKRWLELSKSEDIDSGTTVLTALLQNNQLIVSNVGDSEAVLCRGGVAMPVSVAHNLKSNEDERKRLEEMGARIYKQRLGHPALSERYFSIAVTRAIGDILYKDEEFTMGKPSGLIATPETKVIQLEQSDQFLILACDGLWDVMSHQEACDLVLRAQQRLKEEGLETDWKFLAKMLATRAVKQGSTDNITVLIINLDGSSENGNAYNNGNRHHSSASIHKPRHRRPTRSGRISSAASSGRDRGNDRRSMPAGRMLEGHELDPDRFQHSDEGEMDGDDVVRGSLLDPLKSRSPSKASPRYHQRSVTSFVGTRPASGPATKHSTLPKGYVPEQNNSTSSGPTNDFSGRDMSPVSHGHGSPHQPSVRMGFDPNVLPRAVARPKQPNQATCSTTVPTHPPKGLSIRSTSNASTADSTTSPLSFDSQGDLEGGKPNVMGGSNSSSSFRESTLSTTRGVQGSNIATSPIPTHQRSSTIAHGLRTPLRGHADACECQDGGICDCGLYASSNLHSPLPSTYETAQYANTTSGMTNTSHLYVDVDPYTVRGIVAPKPVNADSNGKSIDSLSDTQGTRRPEECGDGHSPTSRCTSTDSSDQLDETVVTRNPSYPDRNRPFGLSPIHSPAQASSGGNSGSSVDTRMKQMFDHPTTTPTAGVTTGTSVAGFFMSNQPANAANMTENQPTLPSNVSEYSASVPDPFSPSENPVQLGCTVEVDEKATEDTGGEGTHGLSPMITPTSSSLVSASTAAAESNFFGFDRVSTKVTSNLNANLMPNTTMTMTERTLRETALHGPRKYNKVAARKRDQAYVWDFDDDEVELVASTQTHNADIRPTVVAPPLTTTTAEMTVGDVATPAAINSANSAGTHGSFLTSMFSPSTADSTPEHQLSASTTEEGADYEVQDQDNPGYRDGDGPRDEFDEDDLEGRESIASHEIATLCCGMEELKDGRVDELLETKSDIQDYPYDQDTVNATTNTTFHNTTRVMPSNRSGLHSLASMFEPEPAIVAAQVGEGTEKSSEDKVENDIGTNERSQAGLPPPYPVTPATSTTGTKSACKSGSPGTTAAAAVMTTTASLSAASATTAAQTVRTKEKILEDIMSEHFFTIKGPTIRNGRSNLLSLFDPEPSDNQE